MPASLFLAWAGRQSSRKFAATSVTAVTGAEKPRNSVAFAVSREVAEAADTPATTATSAAAPQTAVAGVTGVLEQQLPANALIDQCCSPSSQGNHAIAALAARLDACDPVAWCQLFEVRLAYRQQAVARHRRDAELLAFNDCLLQWHRRRGAHPEPNRCAGCGEPLGNDEALDLGHGARVHFDDRLSCLTRYGQAWRGDAVAGLHGLGLDPPPNFDVL